MERRGCEQLWQSSVLIEGTKSKHREVVPVVWHHLISPFTVRQLIKLRREVF